MQQRLVKERTDQLLAQLILSGGIAVSPTVGFSILYFVSESASNNIGVGRK
jgi:hypothetical protein